MSEANTDRVGGYWRFVAASFSHTNVMILRQKRAILAGTIVLFPVVVPLAMAFLQESATSADGTKVFISMAEMLYLPALAPLLGLFFGCMLIGEEVEFQMMPYLLTRQIPRSALVLGKYLAFWVVTSGMIVPSLFLTFSACTSLANLSFGASSLKLFAQYCLVLIMSLMGYGAFCIFLGSLVKRPIVVGVVLLFGWQRLALLAPGIIDFLTIEKYVKALLPKLAEEHANPAMQEALREFAKKEFLIGATKASISLIIITVFLLAATNFVIRWREYSAARAVEG